MPGEVMPLESGRRHRSTMSSLSGALSAIGAMVRRREGRLFAAPIVVTLSVVTLLWIGIAYHLHQRRAAVLNLARADAADLSTSLSEQVGRLIAGVDQVIHFMQADFARDPARFDFATWTQGADTLVDALVQIAMADETGAIVSSTIPEPRGRPPVSIADREHFMVQMTDRNLGLYIGRAVRGRVSERWSIQLSRRLERPDGSFAGVVVASLDPEYLAHQLARLAVGTDGVVCIVGRDGRLRSRFPFDATSLDVDFRSRPAGQLAFSHFDTVPAGEHVGFTAEDGQFMVGVRSVEGLPLMVAAARPKASILRALRIERRDVVAAGAGTTVLLFALLAWLLRELDQRRRREVELARAYRELGTALTDLKAEVASRESVEEALRQSQKMEALGQLTGGIAHDFNNLLTGITGSLDLLERRIAQGRMETVGRYISAALTSANRAAALTHRLLAFSRRQPLDPRPVDASRLVQGMDDLLRSTIGEAVGLDFVTAPGLWRIHCDPSQLENALLNLVINARDAMPEGGLVAIRARNARPEDLPGPVEVLRPGQYVCLCVSDTGTGMAPDIVAKAFDPFFTTKPIGQGTGLGLSMVYGFAQQSRGFVTIDSTLNRGTSVRLYLPRFHGEADRSDEARTQLGDAHYAARGATVLVVEDEAEIRDLVVEVLREIGYRTIEAADGPSGLEALRSAQPIDLLLTDVGLPGLNGRQIADAARRDRPGLKVLFMTGYAETFAASGGDLETGMGLLTKPFNIESLAAKVRDILTQS